MYILNNPSSIRNHELCQHHKDYVAKRLTVMGKENAAKEKEQKETTHVLEQIEAMSKRKNIHRHQSREEEKKADKIRPPTHPPPSYPHGSTSMRASAPLPQLSSHHGDNVATFDVDAQGSNPRPVLTLEGEGFLPSHDAAKAISKLFKGHYIEPWPSWTKIPETMRKTWSDDFMRKFSIYPPDENIARRNFERRGAALLKNHLEKKRKRMERLHWIGEEVWNGLCTHWQSESFIKKSCVAKANRVSECGGSVGPTHVGGLISMSQHRLNMTKELGVVPSLIESFRKTHQRKDQTWANQKAQQFMEKFTEEMNQRSQSTPDNGDPPLTSLMCGVMLPV